ncbi:MAG: hypothetical protein ABIH69_00005, partial [bacterium]
SPEVRQEALREIKTAAELTAKVVAQTESMPYVSQAKIAPAIQTLVGQVVELLDQPNIAQDAKPIVTELINTLVSLPVGKKAVLKAIEDKLFKPTKLALRPKDSLQQRRLLMDFSEDRAETKDDNLAKMVASFKDSEAVKKLLPLIVKTAPEAKAMMALISETSTSQLTINVVAVSNILRRATELIKTGRSADAAQLLRQLPNTLPELKVPHLEVLTTHLEAEGREVVIQFDRAAQKPITNKVTTQANSVEAKAMDPIMEITDHDVIQTLRIIHEVKTNAKVRAALEQAANVRAITAHDVQLACGHLLPKQVRTQEERGRKAILSIDRGDGTAIPISVISPTGSKGDGKSSDDSHPYKQPYERAPEIITFREDEAAASSF